MQGRKFVGAVAALGVAAGISVGIAPAASAHVDHWMPAPGQAFNDGWRPFSSGATFDPCQEIRWHLDRSGEHPDRNTMIDDIRTGLATLEPHTGLTFVEVTDAGSADLTFRWADLEAEGRGADVAGIGGPRGHGKGAVAFSNTADWTLNKWEGRDWRRLEWPRPDLGPGWYSWNEGPGREALVVHEAMHAMGFGHVEDFTSIMYPQGGIPNNRGELSSGDIAGLNTMYLNNPCPSDIEIPDVEETAESQDDLTVSVRKTKRGARVLASNIDSDGTVTASVKTKLKPGTRATVVVMDYNPGMGKWVESEQRVKVGKNGKVQFTTSADKHNYIYLRDGKGRMLVRWTT